MCVPTGMAEKTPLPPTPTLCINTENGLFLLTDDELCINWFLFPHNALAIRHRVYHRLVREDPRDPSVFSGSGLLNGSGSLSALQVINCPCWELFTLHSRCFRLFPKLNSTGNFSVLDHSFPQLVDTILYGLQWTLLQLNSSNSKKFPPRNLLQCNWTVVLECIIW